MTTVLHLRSVVPGREGQWYRKTLEYGFWKQLDTQVYVDNKRTAYEFHTRSSNERVEKDMYACGFIGPNYPVPAIRYEVLFGGLWVSIWNETWQSGHTNKPWYPDRVCR
jgi:hypothetical protein